MVGLLLPCRDLSTHASYSAPPPFVTSERLKLCWEHVAQVRGLLPHSYCRPHKAEGHAFDSHPFQYATALFYFALKMATQYREPNPYSRRLAVASLTRLAHLTEWLHGREVALLPTLPPPPAARGALRPYWLAYALGQRLCFVHDGLWREGVVLAAVRRAADAHAARCTLAPIPSSATPISTTAHAAAAVRVRCRPPARAAHPRGARQESVVVRRGGTNLHRAVGATGTRRGRC